MFTNWNGDRAIGLITGLGCGYLFVAGIATGRVLPFVLALVILASSLLVPRVQ